MLKELLSGNEAVAHAALESGVQVVTGYPGTPSTQIIETILRSIRTRRDLSISSKDKFPYIEWSINEKVALEVAGAASLSGLRSICVMKNVGLNVGLDFLMTLNLTGTKGSMVVISVDDVGATVSQNEQDSRCLGQLAHLPVLEPVDAQEAAEMTRWAFTFSEKIGLPIIIRMTQDVSLNLQDLPIFHYELNLKKQGEFRKERKELFLVSSTVRESHEALHEKLAKIRNSFEKIPFSWIDQSKDKEIGIITSGYPYIRIKEVLKHLQVKEKVSILKIGMPFPLPIKMVTEFTSNFNNVLVLEEVEPLIEGQVKNILFDCQINTKIIGRDKYAIPHSGSITIPIIRSTICNLLDLKQNKKFQKSKIIKVSLKERSPTFCAGCPHRAAFYALKRVLQRMNIKYIHTSDIGCYGIGAFHPFHLGDTNMCMGSSIGLACGLAHSKIEDTLIIASIGDSTFFHAGMPALVNAVHNKANILVTIHDNEIIGMTGGQPTPSSKENCMGTTNQIMIEEVCRAFKVERVEVLSAFSIQKNVKLIQGIIESKRFPSVIIFKGECPLVIHRKCLKLPKINKSLCNQCLICIEEFGCPAIHREKDQIYIAREACTSCGACIEICPHGAIEFFPLEHHDQ